MTLAERRDADAATTREQAWLRHVLRYDAPEHDLREARRLRQRGVHRLAHVWLPHEGGELFWQEAWRRLREGRE